MTEVLVGLGFSVVGAVLGGMGIAGWVWAWRQFDTDERERRYEQWQTGYRARMREEDERAAQKMAAEQYEAGYRSGFGRPLVAEDDGRAGPIVPVLGKDDGVYHAGPVEMAPETGSGASGPSAGS